MTAVEPTDQLLGEVLSTIEREEHKLLTWGVVDGAFTRAELVELISASLTEQSSVLDAEEVLDSLQEQNLVLQSFINERELYRSRMAEAVRLFARLRQLFPQHAQAGAWRLAPTLVADYRLLLRPRRYPERNITPAQVVTRVQQLVPLNGFRRKVLRALLEQRPSGPLQLANFQVEAIAAILAGSGVRSRGIIIGAGTGSGKTLAFYLPALTRIAELMEREAFWTKALALYPRSELLKDQFAEVYKEARLLDLKLQEAGKRPILIGAYFGATPFDATVRSCEWAGWEKDNHGYICPFLACPTCGRPLIWRSADLQAAREQLSCLHQGCGTVVDPDHVVLTRKRLHSCPPDVLFTTTEMLNRKMSDSRAGPVFGVGASRKPELVLLDEAHTYEGTAGAQAALLLRRWRRACGHQPYFVGLSATLKEAPAFFAQLTGLYRSDVAEATPKEDELISEGMEYLLALRGDPVSGTSLLSTTIQAAMLARRILEPNEAAMAHGAYGKRAFVFTDDLDVTNRLYHNLLDAEGLSAQGRRLAHRAPLASLRGSGTEDADERRADGQVWDLCEQVGHRLDPEARLRISRTSSQDAGVTARSDLIVATAALEVGFNDPEVGAVLQHKAPRNAAAFVQRQGRAGRQRRMRPWTVVVLSDYGRDRLTYQAYDQLFSPELPVRSLPVNNRYVLRMQAVYALMDWVNARRFNLSMGPGSVWDDFTGPSEYLRTRQQAEQELLQRLLDETGIQQDLAEHLRRALHVDDESVRALLWDPPRALLTAAVPTLLRRIKHRWTTASGGTDLQAKNAPLPDFVPANLFSDLNLPEVRLILPPPRQGAEPPEETLGLRQALTAFPPGRVSRRFGVHQSHVSHWIPLPELRAGHQELSIAAYCAEYEALGRFTYVQDGVSHVLPCVRPWTVRLSVRPQNVRDTSNALLDWRTQLVPTPGAAEVDLPEGLAWKDLIVSAEFYVHTLHASVEVRRFALGSFASVALESGEALDSYVQFTDPQSGEPAAVGFNLDVDAFVVRLRLPEHLGIDTQEDTASAKGRAFRTAYFKEVVLRDAALRALANHFRLERLADTYLSALLAHALSTHVSLQDAHGALQAQQGGAGPAMERVLSVVFQAAPTVQVDESPDDSTDAEGLQRLHLDMLALCAMPAVIQALERHAEVLWGAPDAGWRAWAEARFQATVGAAVLEACQRLCPDVAADDLLLDTRPGTTPGVVELWLTEATIGGGGVVEEVLRRYAEDPRRFWRLVEHTLQPSDLEMVDLELTYALQLAEEADDVRESFAAFRRARRHAQTLSATRQLRLTLNAHGLTAGHAIMTALNARILRPGSAPEADQALHQLLTRWHHEEERLGVEIDGRVFAYYACQEPTLRPVIAALAPDSLTNTQAWQFQALTGLFWPRGQSVRAQTLSSHNPYAQQPPADRELVLHVLERAQSVVVLESPTWQVDAVAHLVRYGTVRIASAPEHRHELQRQLARLLTLPIDVGYLQLYARIVALHRTTNQLVATLEIKEAAQ